MFPDSTEFRPRTADTKPKDSITVHVTHFNKGLEAELGELGKVRIKGKILGYLGAQRMYLIETADDLATVEEIKQALSIADSYPQITNSKCVYCLRHSLACMDW
jgi:hypothetical protein